LLLGIIVLVWVRIEEQSELGVLVISGAICTWAAIWILAKPIDSDKRLILRHSLVGAGAGLAIALLAILLMAFKSGIHGHGTPDFTVAQMQFVLSRSPFLILSGVLVGLGSRLWRMARKGQSSQEG
jgi:uncharacterized membrane protein YedE/YeeE